MVVSPGQDEIRAHRYAEDGYIVIDELWGRQQVARVRAEIEDIFKSSTRVRQPSQSPQAVVFDCLLERLFEERFSTYLGAAKLCNHLISLHRLGLDQRVEAVLRELGLSHPTLCARPLLWFHSPRLAKSERYHRLAAHQEWSNMQGSLDGAVVWAPLVDVHADMGRLQVVPGSHREGLLPIGSGREDYPLAIRPDALRDEAFVEVDVPVGGALVFSAFLVHRSGTNRSPRTRLTMNFRYNNAKEPTFIRRDYLNPFTYEAPDRLLMADFPSPDEVRSIRWGR